MQFNFSEKIIHLTKYLKNKILKKNNIEIKIIK